MEKSDSEAKIKVTEVTKKNLKEGQKVRIEPSANIIRMVVDIIAENGLSGAVFKGKDNKFYITADMGFVGDAEEIIECETVVEVKK